MQKFSLDTELVLYADDVETALKNFAKHLEQVAERIGSLPPEALGDLEQPSGGITGEPPGEGDLGWRCIYSISKTKD